MGVKKLELLAVQRRGRRFRMWTHRPRDGRRSETQESESCHRSGRSRLESTRLYKPNFLQYELYLTSNRVGTARKSSIIQSMIISSQKYQLWL